MDHTMRKLRRGVLMKTNLNGDIVTKVKALDGKQYELCFTPINRNDAIFISHNILQSALKTIAGGMSGHDTNERSKFGLLELIQDLSYEKIMQLEGILLRGFLINNEEPGDLIAKRPDIFYLSLFEGIKCNFPDFLTVLQENKTVSGFLKLGKAMYRGFMKVKDDESKAD